MVQNKNFLSITAFILHCILFLSLCSIESLFFSPRNSFIEVDLWIVSLIFLGLHRNVFNGALFAFVSALLFSAFSGIPYHASLLSFFGVLTVVHVIKSRSYAQGPSYFAICSFFALISFYIFYMSSSWILGEAPIKHPHIIQWITSALTSSALFVLIRPLLILIDKFCSIRYPFGFEVEQ